LRVEVLQSRSGTLGTRVFWVEEDVALLAVDAGSQNKIVLAQLGVDPADDLISLWVKDSLLGENAIDPTRVFIATDKAVTAKDGKVVMELTVK
jgi:hypothetical protein